MRAILFLVASMLIGGPAFSQNLKSQRFINGNSLYQDCISQNATRREFCTAYVVGVVDHSFLIDAMESQNSICLPPGVTVAQVRDIAVRGLREAPEERHFGAAGLVYSAVRKAFPCPTR